MPTRDEYLGEFEHIVLLALLRLGNTAYGMSVRSTIYKRIERDVSIGALYATLERLEKKGYVKSRMGESTEKRGGRAKRYFEVTAKGRKVLTDTRDRIEAMWVDWPGYEAVSEGF